MPADREQELLQQIAQEKAEVQRLRQENELLRQKVDALARQLFGKKSEQLEPAQLQLLFQELEAPGPAVGKELGPQSPEADSARPAQAASPRRERAPRLPEHLPVVVETIVPPPVQAAPEQWRQIGEEVTERLDYEPARFLRRRTVRPKYVRRGELDAVPVIAPLPPCFLEKSIATPGLVAQVLVAKYCDHLPLYRQEYIYQSRHGVSLTRQTLCEWVGVAAGWLRLLYEEIRREVLSQGYVQIDETPLRYLEPGHGQTKLGYLWTCHRPGADTVYTWQTSRAARLPGKDRPARLHRHHPVRWLQRLRCFRPQPPGRPNRARRLLGARPAQILRSPFARLQTRHPRPAPFAKPLPHRSPPAGATGQPHPARPGPCLRKPARPRAPAPPAPALENAAPPSAQEPARAGHRLRAGPMELAAALPRRRPPGDRQQPGGKRHPAHGLGQKELALHRRRPRRPARRHHLHADRSLPAARP